MVRSAWCFVGQDDPERPLVRDGMVAEELVGYCGGGCWGVVAVVADEKWKGGGCGSVVDMVMIFVLWEYLVLFSVNIVDDLAVRSAAR